MIKDRYLQMVKNKINKFNQNKNLKLKEIKLFILIMKIFQMNYM